MLSNSQYFELKGGFQAYLTALPIQDVPISSFVEMQNCFVFNGRLKKRPPFYYHTTCSTTSAVYAVAEFYTKRGATVTPHLVYLTNNSIQFLNLSTKAFTSTSALQWGPQFPQYVQAGEINFTEASLNAYPSLGTKFFLDGSSSLQLWPIGVPAPVSICTYSTTSSGGSWTATGTVSYKFIWRTQNDYEVVESNPSAAWSIMVYGTGQVNTITRPAVPQTNITHWCLYRKLATETIYTRIYVTAVASTSVQDGGDLATLSTNDECPVVQNGQAPASPQCIGYHNDRLWVGEAGGRLYYSKVNSPPGSCQNFSSLNYFQVGSLADGFVKLISLPNFLLIVKQKSMWALEGTDASTYRLQKISDYGSFSSQATLWLNGYLYFINETGIWKTTLFDEPVNLALSIWQDFKTIAVPSSADAETYYQMIYDPLTQCIWVYISATQILLLNPNTGTFAGRFNIPSCTNIFTLRKTNKQVTLGLVRNGGAGANFFYLSNIDIFATTIEGSITVAAKTGMAIPDSVSNRKRIFRSIQGFTDLAPESAVTGTTEAISIQVATATSTSFVAVATVSFGTGYFNKVVQRSDRGISVYFVQGTSNPGLQWELGNLKFEYENVGNY